MSQKIAYEYHEILNDTGNGKYTLTVTTRSCVLMFYSIELSWLETLSVNLRVLSFILSCTFLVVCCCGLMQMQSNWIRWTKSRKCQATRWMLWLWLQHNMYMRDILFDVRLICCTSSLDIDAAMLGETEGWPWDILIFRFLVLFLFCDSVVKRKFPRPCGFHLYQMLQVDNSSYKSSFPSQECLLEGISILARRCHVWICTSLFTWAK